MTPLLQGFVFVGQFLKAEIPVFYLVIRILTDKLLCLIHQIFLANVLFLHFDLRQNHELLFVIDSHEVDLIFEAAFPVRAKQIVLPALFVDICEKTFQPVSGKLRVILPKALFHISSILALDRAAISMAKGKPKGQKGFVQLIFHGSAALFGVEGAELGDEAVAVFQTVKITPNDGLQDGLYFHPGAFAGGDEFQDREVNPVILAKLLDQEGFYSD